MRFALTCLAVSLLGCGTPQPRCTILNCSGCCDENDSCQAGTEVAVCGTGGKLCISCPGGQECRSGSCATPVRCSKANCAGCCDSEGRCQVGTALAACGAAGNACNVCSGLQTCQAGVCKATSLDQCNAAAVVTTSQLQSSIITSKCATCHYPASGGMAEGSGYAYADFSTAVRTQSVVGKKSLYAGTAGTLKVVDTSSLANSTLWLKVSSTTSTGRHGPNGEATNASAPQGGPMLSPTELQQIKDWICTGATP